MKAQHALCTLIGGLMATGALAQAGSLDPNFGTGGVVNITLWEHGVGNAVAIQPDGKIVVAGTAGHDQERNIMVMRLNTDGSFDLSFSEDGIATIGSDPGDNDRGEAVAIQPDGKIVVAGSMRNFTDGYDDLALARLNTDGSLDMSFDDDGVVTTSFGGTTASHETVIGVAVRTDGKIVVAGTSLMFPAVQIAVARFGTDGSLDASFGGDGLVLTDLASGPLDMAVQPDGKTLVTCAVNDGAYYQFGVLRVNDDGSMDDTFGNGGVATAILGPEGGTCTCVDVMADGRIVAGGMTHYYESAVVRYTSDGTLDASFDEDGMVITDVPPGWENLRGVRVQTDGKIVTSGDSDGVPTLIRYNVDGSLDATFGTDGFSIHDWGVDNESPQAHAIQADGKIVVVGLNTPTGFTSHVDIARYLGDIGTGAETRVAGDRTIAASYLPHSEEIAVSGTLGNEWVLLLDQQGKVVRRVRSVPGLTVIPARSLAPGHYVVSSQASGRVGSTKLFVP